VNPLWNPKFHYRVHRNQPIAPILRQINESAFPRAIYWKLILLLPSHLGRDLPGDLFPSDFPSELLCTSSLLRTSHMKRTYCCWWGSVRSVPTDHTACRYAIVVDYKCLQVAHVVQSFSFYLEVSFSIKQTAVRKWSNSVWNSVWNIFYINSWRTKINIDCVQKFITYLSENKACRHYIDTFLISCFVDLHLGICV
jgi:hypothetical protein